MSGRQVGQGSRGGLRQPAMTRIDAAGRRGRRIYTAGYVRTLVRVPWRWGARSSLGAHGLKARVRQRRQTGAPRASERVGWRVPAALTAYLAKGFGESLRP